MKHIFLKIIITVSILAIALNASAQDEIDEAPLGTSDEVFARQGSVVLTHGELDAAFSRVPQEARLNFIRNGQRVDQLVQSLLLNKLMAEKAGDYANEPLVEKRMALLAEKELAEAWMQKILEEAPEADIEALAHEGYLADPSQYTSPEVVDVTHILINNEDRSDEEALALALSVRAQLVAGEIELDAAVEEYSDDPSKFANAGRFPKTTRGQMVAEFEKVAFSMREEGAYSEPVKTGYGYHIIRLNKRIPPAVLPFDEIKNNLMIEARKRYAAEYGARYRQSVLTSPVELDQSEVEKMVKRYFGDDLELAPDYGQ